MPNFIVTCDGGSLGNGTENSEGYGSFLVEMPGQDSRFTSSRGYGQGVTNNEAEYLALLDALIHIKTAFESAATDLKTIHITVRTDSNLIIGHLTQGWKVKPSLLYCVNSAKDLIAVFGSVTFDKISGQRMKEILGH